MRAHPKKFLKLEKNLKKVPRIIYLIKLMTKNPVLFYQNWKRHKIAKNKHKMEKNLSMLLNLT